MTVLRVTPIRAAKALWESTRLVRISVMRSGSPWAERARCRGIELLKRYLQLNLRERTCQAPRRVGSRGQGQRPGRRSAILRLQRQDRAARNRLVLLWG